MIENIEKNLSILTQNKNIANLFNDVNNSGDAVIFGGSIRDWCLDIEPHDIDIAVDANDLSFVKKYSFYKNSFGGYKVNIDNIEFDIWSVKDTWAYQQDKSFSPNLQSLPQTVFMNFDAVVYNIKTKEIHDYGFKQCLESKVLDIIYEPNSYPKYCSYKSLYMVLKYNLTLSSRLKEYILSNPIDEKYSDFIQKKKHGKIIYSYGELIKCLMQ